MNNFGVIELAGAKTTSAPGWAYIPDTRPDPASTTLQPSNRKRARNAASGATAHTIGDLSARQEARIRKEIEALDREGGGRDSQIPVPLKNGKPHVGKTVNVRKILQSQKTFANHLDDFLALQAQNEAAAAAAAAAAAKRSSNKAAAPSADHPMPDAPSTSSTTKKSKKDSGNASQPILVPSYRPSPPEHPGDTDALLMSRVPEPPAEEELRKLLAHPPLSYVEARGKWDEETAGRYPTRKFCAVCGYWGRVRCMKCGTRVCALECLETHREECVTRYGM
ncbi:hypothetical protein NLU13_9133 [Sarocladium strictum]|uniref:HIT-type domain-containing protein n=1 Tax=Sarocladium strictum TaxID=5046 RepID=A0AA39G9K8_SARSR|nr:hypothetical protein NLU13_9133 [Sarocladium strictum]